MKRRGVAEDQSSFRLTHLRRLSFRSGRDFGRVCDISIRKVRMRARYRQIPAVRAPATQRLASSAVSLPRSNATKVQHRRTRRNWPVLNCWTGRCPRPTSAGHPARTDGAPCPPTSASSAEPTRPACLGLVMQNHTDLVGLAHICAQNARTASTKEVARKLWSMALEYRAEAMVLDGSIPIDLGPAPPD